jgi:cytidylate kinase
VIRCAVLGAGVFTEVNAGAIMLPGEGFVKAVATTVDREFGITKVWVDVSLTVIAIVISLVMFQRIRGVGLGTIIAAVLTGMMSNAWGKVLGPVITRILSGQTEENAEAEESALREAVAEKKIVITIGREYGCGAAEIAKLISQKLGISYYNKDLVDMVAEESGLTAEYVIKNQEKLTNRFLYDLYKQTYAYTSGEQTRADALHYAEQKVIKRITEQESCVIMGRVSNFVLDGAENAFHVFLYAPAEVAVKNVMGQDGLSESEAKRKIRQVNAERSNYYREYSKKEWGRADSYDLTVNTGLYSPEKTADIIIDMMKACGKL